MHNKVILPRSFYETDYQPDPSFVKRMNNIDKYLLVYWNRFRSRWIIDRYNCETDHTHHPACPRTNVHVVQSDEGGYHPLNDRVLDYLRKGDMWKTSPDEINRALDEAKAAYDSSREDDLKHFVRESIHDEHIHSDSSFPTIFPRLG
jgi:hypothetical protein